MSKYLREFSNSKVYHIIIKGIDDGIIFYDDEDRNVFLNKLKVTKKKFKYKILAYCLMNNHVHLVISIENENLSNEEKEAINDSINIDSLNYDKRSISKDFLKFCSENQIKGKYMKYGLNLIKEI